MKRAISENHKHRDNYDGEFHVAIKKTNYKHMKFRLMPECFLTVLPA